MSKQELERSYNSALKAPKIIWFFEPKQIDYSYYKKPFYIVPTAGGEYGYALIREALTRTTTMALSRFYFYGNEQLAVIEVNQDVLILHGLQYVDEIAPPNDTHPCTATTKSRRHRFDDVDC